jgi:hypothetical protein
MRSIKGVQRNVKKVMGAVTFYTDVLLFPLQSHPMSFQVRRTKTIARVY